MRVLTSWLTDVQGVLLSYWHGRVRDSCVPAVKCGSPQHLPSALRLLLMACASLSRCPVAPLSLTRSEPARSIRLSTPDTWRDGTGACESEIALGLARLLVRVTCGEQWLWSGLGLVGLGLGQLASEHSGQVLRTVTRRTLTSVLVLTPSMRSVNTMWLREDCSLSAVKPTVLHGGTAGTVDTDKLCTATSVKTHSYSQHQCPSSSRCHAAPTADLRDGHGVFPQTSPD